MGLSTAPNALTHSQLKNASPSVLVKFWDTALRRGGALTANPLTQWMAASETGETEEGISGAPICIINNLSKVGGETVKFTNYRDVNQAPVLGDDRLMGNERTPEFGDYDVFIDNVRVAMAWTQKTVRALAKEGKTVEVITRLTRRSIELKARDFALQRLVESASLGRNLVCSDPAKTRDTLRSTDKFSTSAIDNIASVLSSIGASPISSRKLKNGASVPNYLFFGPSDCVKSLNADTQYRNALVNASDRGEQNPLFSGGYHDWNGNRIWHWLTPREDTQGPIGTHLNPMAECGEAITAATTAFRLRGGGGKPDFASALPSDHFRYFPAGNAAIFAQFKGEVRPNNTDQYYVKAIVNDGGVNHGKWCLYRYVGNDNEGTGILINQRLAAAASGVAATTVGNVVWNGAIHTEAIPQGSMFYWANAWGEVLGNVLALGSDALLFAYGVGAMGNKKSSMGFNSKGVQAIANMARAEEVEDGDDYGMVQALAAHAVFGTGVPRDTQNRYKNHVVCPVVYDPPTGGGRAV
jgi:hypothetical protein